jgi:steroid 5-alpha reductase family enzyme
MIGQALSLLLTGGGIVAATMFLLWLVHLVIRNAAVVDVGWAAGLGLLALF